MSDMEQKLLSYLFEKYNKTLDDKKQVSFIISDYSVFGYKNTDDVIEINKVLFSLHNQGYIIYPTHKNLHIYASWLTITDKTFNYFNNEKIGGQHK